MELVIKIPEEVKNRLCFGVTYTEDIQTVCEALHNGTPLPKGHGKIADLSAVYEDICKDLNEMTRIGVVIDGDWLWAKLNDAIDHAITIIEADEG